MLTIKKSLNIGFLFVVLTARGLEFASENFIRGMLYPLGRTVLKLKRVSIKFHKVSWFLTNTIFTSIPVDTKRPGFHIFMPFVHNL